MRTTASAAAAAAALAAVVLAAGLPTAASAQSRDQIRIVGSSTVFPFTSTVIERFAQGGQFATPVIESTGTGGGMQLFCAGVGAEHPDMTGASRPMRASEWEACQQAGVTDITELQIGFDGIVLANSRQGPQVDVTKAQLWQALAKEVPVNGEIVANPYTRWSEIDPSLPDEEIEIYGPPPTSGTRDAFVELVMDEGCGEFAEVAALEESDEARFEAVCQTMREDGRFIEAGENDNIIVQRLESNPAAFGIFGFSFLDQNQDRLQGARIGGVEPTFENIAAGDYGVSRSLFMYVKNQHADVIPGIREFLTEYTSDAALGDEGYLADKGLIPLPAEEREGLRATASGMQPMSAPAS